MPIISAQEKKKWAEQALQQFNQCFQNEEKMAAAVKDRQSLSRNHDAIGVSSSLTPAELEKALAAIDVGDETTYTIHDPQRFGTLLGGIGISKQEIDAIKKSDVLRIEAALFNAVTEIDIKHAKPRYLTRIQDLSEENNLEEQERVKDESKESEKKLSKSLLPAVQEQFYLVAKADLQKALERKDINPHLREWGNGILKETEKVKSTIPLGELTQTLSIVKATVVTNTPSEGDRRRCIEQSDKLTKFPKGKTLSNLLLGLAGVALILSSVVAVGLSLGASTPLSIVGVIAGASMVASSLGLEASSLHQFFRENKLKTGLKHIKDIKQNNEAVEKGVDENLERKSSI